MLLPPHGAGSSQKAVFAGAVLHIKNESSIKTGPFDEDPEKTARLEVVCSLCFCSVIK